MLLAAGAAASGAQRGVPVDQHPGVHPADPVRQLLQQLRQPGRVVHGEQAVAGERVEAGQGAGEAADVPDVQLHQPGPEVADHPQQQVLHQRLGRLPAVRGRADLQVRLVEQRNGDREAVRRPVPDPAADRGTTARAPGRWPRPRPRPAESSAPGRRPPRAPPSPAASVSSSGPVLEPRGERRVPVRLDPADRPEQLLVGQQRRAARDRSGRRPGPSSRSHISTMASACARTAASRRPLRGAQRTARSRRRARRRPR